ncbi:MAG: CBM9 family sugar-binding protein, partial [Armatimonadota bacterium]|nr:CBM9 family sugar-binding protein [Armatimonadota bacterium]
LELFIGSEKIGEGGPLLFTDRQVLLGAGANGQVYLANAPQQFPIETIVVPGVDGKSYTLEAAIPWQALAIQPKEGQELLFDLAINDSPSGTNRERQLMWNGTAKNSGDRTHWGGAKLIR